MTTYKCKFCGWVFFTMGARDAHEWTCKPWEHDA